MDYLPKDPAILVSSVNMLLRDEEFDTLESLCYNFGIYLISINMVTFFVYGIDKRRSTSDCLLPTGLKKAKKSKRRIRETTLLGLAVLGGSVGAWLGMKVWHHKTLSSAGDLIPI